MLGPPFIGKRLHKFVKTLNMCCPANYPCLFQFCAVDVIGVLMWTRWNLSLLHINVLPHVLTAVRENLCLRLYKYLASDHHWRRCEVNMISKTRVFSSRMKFVLWWLFFRVQKTFCRQIACGCPAFIGTSKKYLWFSTILVKFLMPCYGSPTVKHSFSAIEAHCQ